MSKLILLSGLAVVALTTATQAQTTTATPQTSPRTSAAVDFGAIKGADAMANSDSVGVVRDVLVSSVGQVRQVIIGEGGLLGFGQTLRVAPVDGLNLDASGKVRLSGLTKDGISQLPAYDKASAPREPAGAISVPVSGANQMAPQSATTDIPVAPNAVARPAVQAAAPRDPSKVEPPPPVIPSLDTEEEAAAIRAAGAASSGASGMAPQQGTGSGLTQVGGSSQSQATSGPPPSTTSPLNRDYARETTPSDKPAEQQDNSSAASQSTGAAAAGAARANDTIPVPSQAAAPEAQDSEKRWRVGKIVGGPVRGLEDGLYVKAIRFADGRQAVVTLGQAGAAQTRELPFETLLIDGTADDPLVAVGPGGGFR